MKFRNGSKVEALIKKDVSLTSWFFAEFGSENERYNNVKYDDCLPGALSAEEKVPRRSINPCPPPILRREFIPGEIVEVFVNNYWQPAEMIMVIDGGNCCFVRLIGRYEELKIRRSNVRLRQPWNGNKLILTNEDSEQLEEGNMEMLSELRQFPPQKLQRCSVVRKPRGFGQSYTRKDKPADEVEHGFLSSIKRSWLFPPNIEASVGAGVGRRKGAAKKEVKRQRLFEIPKKVDVFASPQIMFGEKRTDASTNNKLTGFLQPDRNWGRPNDDADYFFSRNLESNDSDSTQSSVGSCSPSNSQYMSFDNQRTCPNQDTSLDVDDFEALSGSGDEPCEHREGRGMDEIHHLELNAYRSILVALYASGPLSWEQEAMLTNLRLVLHVTNDEQLIELRHLATTKSNPAYR